MKKRHDIALILIVLLGIATIGFSLYDYLNKEEVQEVAVEEVSEEPVVEEPKLLGPNEVLIQIFRNKFDKTEITIETGTKVIWKNMDTRRHMITNKRLGLFRTMRKSLEYGDTFEYTFNEPGIYEILEANFGINGYVIVEEPKPNLITGYVVSNLELNGLSFLLISINLFVITALALVIGFHISRKQQK
ncbi:hypothetical protein CEE44_04045 [Candidatus Woesearchaeota archaeon B3_Woes]|nr:MAG: hypothetical protein CEE44_04045 [Candidatus Woesearchaeota archaeon B3_Woes]